VIRLLVIAYVVWCAGLYLRQDSLIFPTGMTPPPRDRPFREDTVVIRLDVEEGGQVEAWFVPAPGVGPDNPGPLVVSFHGNAETIDDSDGLVRAYLDVGCSVLLPEYRGYGHCAGKPSQKAIVSDCVRFYDEVVKRPEVDRSRIVYHGRSLGGAVAAALVPHRKPAALILEQTFSSTGAMAHGYGAPAFLARHPFRTDRVVAGTTMPLFLAHGTHDRIVPVRHGRKLRDLAPRAVYIEYACGHNDFPGVGNERERWSEICAFLGSAGVLEHAVE